MEASTVSESHSALLLNEKLCDASFAVGENGEIIKCHRIHLIARSPVFETMFAERWNPQEVIPIPDVEPSVFRQFLQFMYADAFTTRLDEAMKLLYVAAKYQVVPLVQRCGILMKSELRLANAIEVYRTAVHFDMISLQEEALNFMAREFSDLILHSTFLTMDEKMLLHLLPRDDLKVDELELIKALKWWSMEQLKARGTSSPASSDQRNVLQKILPFVRFPLISPRNFAETVIPKHILSLEDAVNLFTYMNSGPKDRIRLGPELGFSMKPRLPPGTHSTIDFYEKKRTGDLRSSYFSSVSNHVDSAEFSYEWGMGIPYQPSFKTVSIRSIVLRGANYSIIRTTTLLHWPKTWRASLKLKEYSSSYIYPPSMDTERVVGDIQLFNDKDTRVAIEPPFVLYPGCKYRASVYYHSPVYLLHPEGQIVVQHYPTNVLKTNGAYQIKNIISPIVVNIAHCIKTSSRNFHGTHFPKSHCIRAMNVTHHSPENTSA